MPRAQGAWGGISSETTPVGGGIGGNELGGRAGYQTWSHEVKARSSLSLLLPATFDSLVVLVLLQGGGLSDAVRASSIAIKPVADQYVSTIASLPPIISHLPSPFLSHPSLYPCVSLPSLLPWSSFSFLPLCPCFPLPSPSSILLPPHASSRRPWTAHYSRATFPASTPTIPMAPVG
eukprot:753536-Hanusia_phi.AAC.4